jgi:DNA replication and repair protein RecF
VLTHLKARGFRNLEPLAWNIGPGRSLVLGGNGAGKTSLLEAVYVLATTRSFRAPRLAVCVHHGEDTFALETEVEEERRWRLEVSWSREDGLVRAVDGGATSLAGHLSVLPVVAWTGEEGEVVTGEPGLRRRFLDRGVVGTRPGAIDALSRYRQTLDQKRALLSSEPASGPLGPWNELLAEAAAEVIAARARYVAALSERLREVLDEAELGFPEIGLRYRPSPRKGEEGAATIREVLERVAERERSVGFALVGPQRDALEILWAGRPVREVVSAGERKAVSLLLSAAHGRVLETAGRRPLYLLDDVDAELAPDTLRRVWSCFGGVRQMIATSNRPEVWDGRDVDRVWTVTDGRLSES